MKVEFNSIAFGNRLQKCRQEQGLTVKELAEKVKVTTGYINNLERGNSTAPSIDKLCMFCVALNTSMDFLLEDSLEIYSHNLGDSREDEELLNTFHRLSSEKKEILLNIASSFQVYKELEANREETAPLRALSTCIENSDELNDFIYNLAALDNEELKFMTENLKFMISNLKTLKMRTNGENDV